MTASTDGRRGWPSSPIAGRRSSRRLQRSTSACTSRPTWSPLAAAPAWLRAARARPGLQSLHLAVPRLATAVELHRRIRGPCHPCPEVEALNLVEESVDVGGLLALDPAAAAGRGAHERGGVRARGVPAVLGGAVAERARRSPGSSAGATCDGLRVLELGCGLGLPSIVAALGGARVLATDWSPEALEVAAANAEREPRRRSKRRSSRGPIPSAPRTAAPWDLVLGADLLYERRNVDQLLALLPRLGGEVLLAEPGRPPAARFFDEVRARGDAARRAGLPAHRPGPVIRRGPEASAPRPARRSSRRRRARRASSGSRSAARRRRTAASGCSA